MTATAVKLTARPARQRAVVTELPPGRRPAGRRAAPPTCRQRGRRPLAVAPPSRIKLIAASATAMPRPVTSARVRLTRRGRLLVTLLTLALLVGAFSMGRGSASPAAAAAPARPPAVISVGAGDTLWSIAREVRPHSDPRRVVDQLVKLNHLDGRPLQSGRHLLVPGQE